MKKTAKRCIAVMLCVWMCMGLLPWGITAFAADISSGTCGDSAYWEMDETSGVLSITGTGDMKNYSGAQYVPWRSFSYNSVVIGEGITGISSYAFYSSSTYNHDNFTTIDIPKSLERIGKEAFYNCTNLQTVNYGGPAEDWVKIELATEEYSSTPMEYAEKILIDGAEPTEVILPEGIESVYPYAFYGWRQLQTVVLPDSIQNIGEEAFVGTPFLNDPENRENGVLYSGHHLIKADTSLSGTYTVKPGTLCIANDAFWGCDSVTKIVLPDSLRSFGEYAFSGCSGLTSITFPASVTRIASYAFRNCTSLQSITIPGTVTTIGAYAFSGCSALKDVTLSEGLVSIEKYAFRTCGFSEIELPETLTTMGSAVFYSCTKLQSIILPIGVTGLGESLFSGCKALTAVTIPDTAKSIGANAFRSCTALKDVYFLGSEEMWKSMNVGADVIPATAEMHYNWHIHGLNLDSTTDPTCTQTGSREYSCPISCGYTRTEEIAALGHSFGEWERLTESTCTVMGTEKRTCARCQAEENRDIILKPHQLQRVTIPATCAEAGESHFECKVCGTVSGERTPIEKLPHTFGAWTTATASTCTEKGSEQRVCTACSETETRETAIANHQPETVTVAATCTATGESYSQCKVCKAVIGEKTTLEKLPHTFGAWTTVTASTCTEKGSEQRVCSVCSEKETRETALADHQIETVTTQPTCTATGGSYNQCKVCKAVIGGGIILEKLPHTFGAWQTKTPATILSAGQKARTCSVCGENETQTIPVLPSVALRDSATGISVITAEVPATLTLKVQAVTSGDVLSISPLASGECRAYKISLISEGTELQNVGLTQITIPVPAGMDASKCTFYTVNTSKKTATKISVSVQSGAVTFTASDLGVFAVVQPLNTKITVKTPASAQYKSTFTATADVEGMPKDAKIVWSSNAKVELTPSKDGKSCTVSADVRSNIQVTAKVVDASGKTINNAESSKSVKVEMAFWQWIIYIVLFGFIWY